MPYLGLLPLSILPDLRRGESPSDSEESELDKGTSRGNVTEVRTSLSITVQYSVTSKEH